MTTSGTPGSSAPISFERVALDDVPWASLERAPDRTVFQTREWLEFLVTTQRVDPVVARVHQDGEPIGWFTGATMRRRGLTFLGCPLRGWTTPAMGFNLVPGVDRTAALAALPSYAFSDLRCIHLEFADRSLTRDEDVPDGFEIGHLGGYELALERGGVALDDDGLMDAMAKNGRRDVRRALRNGIVVEEVPATDPEFAAQYYAQVAEAFAKRDLVPTYPVERVSAVMEHLGPSGRLLLLRSYTPDGDLAATGIFPGLSGSTAEYWMGGSYRTHQALLPNEALMWTAIRTWRDRGAVRFNFGGGGKYKAKYGGEPHRLPWVRRSRFRGLEQARKTAWSLYKRQQRRSGAAARATSSA